jgi:hypothetical protein
MQEAEITPQEAQPAPGWTFSERLKRWVEPGASPFNGVVPPKHGQFQRGVSDPRQSKGGTISARTRELLRQDERILDKIAKRWLRDCERGDNRAREQLLDRLEGKVEQSIKAELTTRYVIEEVGFDSVDINAETPADAEVSEGEGS